MCLRGAAADWWRDLCTSMQQPGTWEQMKEALIKMFMPVSRSMQSRDRLADLKQRDRDSVTSYASYFRRLCLSIPDIHEGEKLDRFTRGLLPHLRREVIINRADTVEKAILIAAQHEGLRRMVKGSITATARQRVATTSLPIGMTPWSWVPCSMSRAMQRQSVT
jgi:hypothetical protein